MEDSFFDSSPEFCLLLDLHRRPPRTDRGGSHEQRHGSQVSKTCGENQTAAVCCKCRSQNSTWWWWLQWRWGMMVMVITIINDATGHRSPWACPPFLLSAGWCLWFPAGNFNTIQVSVCSSAASHQGDFKPSLSFLFHLYQLCRSFYSLFSSWSHLINVLRSWSCTKRSCCWSLLCWWWIRWTCQRLTTNWRSWRSSCRTQEVSDTAVFLVYIDINWNCFLNLPVPSCRFLCSAAWRHDTKQVPDLQTRGPRLCQHRVWCWPFKKLHQRVTGWRSSHGNGRRPQSQTEDSSALPPCDRNTNNVCLTDYVSDQQRTASRAGVGNHSDSVLGSGELIASGRRTWAGNISHLNFDSADRRSPELSVWTKFFFVVKNLL